MPIQTDYDFQRLRYSRAGLLLDIMKGMGKKYEIYKRIIIHAWGLFLGIMVFAGIMVDIYLFSKWF